MPKTQQQEKDTTVRKKGNTVKNTYIKKLNSLMKINNEEKETEQHRLYDLVDSNRKKIRKYHSDSKLQNLSTDKYALKLERNRESAKKAR